MGKQQNRQLSTALLDWYDQNARTLPWRNRHTSPSDPYHVWLSEIMLQQTTVPTVIPYFESFLTLWPTVDALAGAELDDILHAWQGLGYYARARNLHKCAGVVSRDHAGLFPDNETDLLKLPGVGPYTAAAIAAIAFKLPTVPVDGNIERVMSRLHAIEEPVRQTKDRVRSLATEIMPGDRAGDFAQALMDLGSMVCRPKSPKCEQCPWSGSCVAFKKGKADQYPVKLAKKPKPVRHGVAFWLQNAEGDIWLRKRPLRGLLGGMIEVPSTDWREQPWAAVEIEDMKLLNADWTEITGHVTHTFTHFHLKISVWAGVTSANNNEDGFWCSPDQFSEQALPTLMKKIVRHAHLRHARQ